jgi:hypothetical protein
MNYKCNTQEDKYLVPLTIRIKGKEWHHPFAENYYSYKRGEDGNNPSPGLYSLEFEDKDKNRVEIYFVSIILDEKLKLANEDESELEYPWVWVEEEWENVIKVSKYLLSHEWTPHDGLDGFTSGDVYPYVEEGKEFINNGGEFHIGVEEQLHSDIQKGMIYYSPREDEILNRSEVA